MSTPVPSMNTMVDSITDAVESVIHRSSNHPGGLRRFLLQGAVRHILRDINAHRTPPRRSSGGRPLSPRLELRSSPRPAPRSSRLLFALGVYPEHGPAMFIRRARVPTEMPPMPSSLPIPPMMPLPPPPPLLSTVLARPWNVGGGSMAARRVAPPLLNRDAGTDAWPPGFAYDINVALPPPPPLSSRSYADVAASCRPIQRRNALPNANVLGAEFASSSNEGEAAPRL